MNNSISPETKKKLTDLLINKGELTMEEAIDFISPHVICDYQKLRIQLVKRIVRNIVSSVKDEKGIRSCFAVKREKGTAYVNLETFFTFYNRFPVTCNYFFQHL